MDRPLSSRFSGVSGDIRPPTTGPGPKSRAEPYLDLIAVSDLRHIAEACNRVGWLDLRKRLLDPRIGSCRSVWSPESASAQFASLAVKGRYHWINLEVDEALKTGVSWDEYLGGMRVWFAERPTFDALQLLAAALAHKGLRRDLSALGIYEGMPVEARQGFDRRCDLCG
jgi:hypothetical protein